ncbi:MAG TPA: pyridoxamine kinase [Clostridiales bacterium]|nr:pyridoxamine kinase [Clostridiales bacterium]
MVYQKRVAAIHDISCCGRCSLTVALPIISAAGIETSVIPTAILSTHTGGFTGYTFRDLTEDIMPIISHWESLNLRLDALYTGYLGSIRQIDIISQIFDIYKPKGTKIIVDPVMGDNGKLYASFSEDFPKGMIKLCKKADILIPNITEALFLIGEPYKEGPYTEEYIISLLKKLASIGPEQVVLTGVYFDDKNLGAACFDKNTNSVNFAFADRIEGYYHGTGDVFGSAIVAAVMNSLPLKDAIQTAVDFTVGCIRRTKDAGTDKRYGVNFEAGLAEFARSLLR